MTPVVVLVVDCVIPGLLPRLVKTGAVNGVDRHLVKIGALFASPVPGVNRHHEMITGAKLPTLASLVVISLKSGDHWHVTRLHEMTVALVKLGALLVVVDRRRVTLKMRILAFHRCR
jgi:hypothetical protein